MGTNKRYAAHYDRLMDKRITERDMIGEPHSLTPDELELDKQPLTRTPIPLEAKAWVRYGPNAMRIDVRVVAWTPKAVAITWDTPLGEHKAWVWSSAVDPVQGRA